MSHLVRDRESLAYRSVMSVDTDDGLLILPIYETRQVVFQSLVEYSRALGLSDSFDRHRSFGDLVGRQQILNDSLNFSSSNCHGSAPFVSCSFYASLNEVPHLFGVGAQIRCFDRLRYHPFG